ncbi:response regulator [Actinoplanes friuliensis]|jgi:DNA-binding response OmpR family regulator|uniref:Putative transcriptional regulator ycf27 n=1 Tax=Actinoplanes friuliensis DSM 7358 TaxID=1246995 RepID=U5WEF4_9ACTN|nr:response regulator [Actinoplanes friuliensis]AGZ46321.1 putative transcriptional regulator ycf27 [Actinoplanes friuliensis DSM 7358]
MTEVPQERPMVLVVDDEEDLRDIMRRMLERRGFATLVAGDADQAIAVCREHPGVIDVLVTDLGLPGVSGGDLARTASGLRPEMGVVYISGLPKDIAVTKGLIAEDALLVKKPFTSDLLLEALRSILAQRAPTA